MDSQYTTLLTLAMQITDEEGEPNDLMSVEGMDMVLALELSQKGINDREELAEQSIEELTSLIEISEEVTNGELFDIVVDASNLPTILHAIQEEI